MKKLIQNLARTALLAFACSALPLWAGSKPAATLTISGTPAVVPVGARVSITGTATDPDGDMIQHWLEAKRPAGDWSWDGWLTTEPWGPTLYGNGYASTKSAQFVLTDIGTYVFRTTALDQEYNTPTYQDWAISNEITITVVAATSANSLPVVTLLSPAAQTVAQNTVITVQGQASDINGTMTEHWLEAKRPAGDWSWEGWLTAEPWAGQIQGDAYSSFKSTSFTLTDKGTYVFRTTAYDPQFQQWKISSEVSIYVTGNYTTPSYTPSFWNDSGTIQYSNNCYNYANNVRTDTFAQPGRAAGNMWSSLTASNVSAAATSDGLEPTTASGTSSVGKTKIALVIWLNNDYHWYRKDSNGLWTHKPGGTEATNLDNSGNIITNPETADRGPYTIFAGYFFTPSDATEGAGHANIN